MSQDAQGLVPSISIDNLLAQRDAMVERLAGMAKLHHELEELSQAALGDDSAVPRFECRRSHASLPEGLDQLGRAIDAAMWAHLMRESGLYTFMDATARGQWQKDIYDKKVPPLTEENVRSTFRTLYDKRGEMFERGVVAVFKKLSWDYKTNAPCMFGKRIIMKYLLDVWGSSGQKYITGPKRTGCNQLDDLLRVLHMLDGKPEPDHRQGAYEQMRGCCGISKPVPSEPIVLSDMLSIRLYRNGNGHITFLRMDLVTKMNQIVAKHYPGALPPKRG